MLNAVATIDNAAAAESLCRLGPLPLLLMPVLLPMRVSAHAATAGAGGGVVLLVLMPLGMRLLHGARGSPGAIPAGTQSAASGIVIIHPGWGWLLDAGAAIV